MITSLDHIHLHAADPWETIRFYESCLGAERLGSIPSGEGGENHGVLLGGQLLVISEFSPGMGPALLAHWDLLGTELRGTRCHVELRCT